MTRNPRRARLWRVLFWLTLVVLVGSLGWRLWLQADQRQGEADRAAALAETDALDARWRWDDVAADRPAIVGDRTALAVVLDVSSSLKLRPFGKLLSRWNGDAFPGQLVPNHLLDVADLGHLAALRDERADIFALTEQLHTLPPGRAEPRPTTPPHLEPCRETIHLLEIAGEHALHEYRVSAAVAGVHAMLRTGAVLRGEPGDLAQLVRMGIRGLAARRVERILGLSEPDTATLAELQGLLLDEADENLTVPGLRGERASGNLVFERLQSGAAPLGEVLHDLERRPRASRTWWENSSAALHAYYLAGDHAAYLRWCNRLLAVAELPFAEQVPGWQQLDDDLMAARRTEGMEGRTRITLRVLRELIQFGAAGPRNHVLLTSTATAVAVDRFRRDQQRWPEQLSDLVPAYLPAVPVDPYSGQSLRYRHFPDGVAVYSVGRNGTDDGGVQLEAGNAFPDASDLGIRLWNSEQRRLAPVEPAQNPREVAP